MHFLKRRCAVRMYRAESLSVDVDKLQANSFRSVGNILDATESWGWVDPDNCLMGPTAESIRCGEYLTLAFRVDRKTISEPLLRSTIAAEEAGRKLSLEERKSIRESCRRHILDITSPRTSIYKALVNRGAGTVYLLSASNSVATIFEQLFRDTFGPLQEQCKIVDAETHSGEQFLLGLIDNAPEWKISVSSGEITYFPTDSVKLRDLDSNSAAFRQTAPHKPAVEWIASGYNPVSCGFVAAICGLEFHFTLHRNLTMTSLVLPQPSTADKEDRFYELADSLELICDAIAEVYKREITDE